jgi:hypothetical protein
MPTKRKDPLATLATSPVRLDDPQHLARVIVALKRRMRSLINQTGRWRARALRAEAALARTQERERARDA